MGLTVCWPRTRWQTVLGQYLDPIADKLLLSTMFMVLSILHKIPWKFTVLVFSRDITILMASAVLYAIAGFARLPPQHLRQSQHVRAGCGGLFRFTVRNKQIAMGCYWQLRCVFAGDFCLHDYFCNALRAPRGPASTSPSPGCNIAPRQRPGLTRAVM